MPSRGQSYKYIEKECSKLRCDAVVPLGCSECLDDLALLARVKEGAERTDGLATAAGSEVLGKSLVVTGRRPAGLTDGLSYEALHSRRGS